MSPDVTVSDMTVPAATVPDATGPAVTPVVPEPVVPIGFTTVTVRITAADGSSCERCVWLADSSVERGRGLMGVTDLGAAAGMLFTWPSPVESSFFMFQTPTALDIAWFADGAFVSATTMEPCAEPDPARCARYDAGAPFDVAIETFRGGLPELGVGATLEVVEGSEATVCPAEG